MITTTLEEAQRCLSQLVDQVQAGETVVITSGLEDTPVATINAVVRELPENTAKPPRRLGAWAHLGVEIPDSFFDPLPEEELRLWYGQE